VTQSLPEGRLKLVSAVTAPIMQYLLTNFGNVFMPQGLFDTFAENYSVNHSFWTVLFRARALFVNAIEIYILHSEKPIFVSEQIQPFRPHTRYAISTSVIHEICDTTLNIPVLSALEKIAPTLRYGVHEQCAEIRT